MTRDQAIRRRKDAINLLDALKREIAALDFALTGFAPMAWPTGVPLTPTHPTGPRASKMSQQSEEHGLCPQH